MEWCKKPISTLAVLLPTLILSLLTDAFSDKQAFRTRNWFSNTFYQWIWFSKKFKSFMKDFNSSSDTFNAFVAEAAGVNPSGQVHF